MEEEEEANKIPKDLWVDILQRLLMKSLLRYMSVCKNWHSPISINSFFTIHTNRALSQRDDNNKSSTVLFRYEKLISFSLFELFSLYFDDGSFGHNKNLIELKCPLKTTVYLYGFPNKVGSWNGAICLAYDDPIHGEGFTIWNPSINRAIALEDPNFMFSSHGNLMHSHGFGYDPSSNDIKLVRLVYLQVCDDYDQWNPPIYREGDDNNYRVPLLVKIYTLNNGHW